MTEAGHRAAAGQSRNGMETGDQRKVKVARDTRFFIRACKGLKMPREERFRVAEHHRAGLWARCVAAANMPFTVER